MLVFLDLNGKKLNIAVSLGLGIAKGNENKYIKWRGEIWWYEI